MEVHAELMKQDLSGEQLTGPNLSPTKNPSWLFGAGRWLARGVIYASVDTEQSKRRNLEKLDDPVAEGLRLAKLEEEADAYPPADPISGYPRPITPGVTVYPDLSLGSPNFDHADPKYQEALDMIGRLAHR